MQPGYMQRGVSHQSKKPQENRQGLGTPGPHGSPKLRGPSSAVATALYPLGLRPPPSFDPASSLCLYTKMSRQTLYGATLEVLRHHMRAHSVLFKASTKQAPTCIRIPS